MQNRPPLILSLDATKQANQKYKFWDTTITGNQRSPKNMNLLMSTQDTPAQNSGQQALPVPRSRQPSLVSDFGSNLSDQGDKSSQHETDERIKSLQDQIQTLQLRIEQNRVLNQNLVKQLNKTTNQLRVSEGLNQELNQQCDRLYQNVKVTHEKHSQIQNQKMALLIQISGLNQQKELAINKAQIFQQQVQYLNKKIQTLYEENSFQKSISTDLKKQSAMLKQQLNKMLVMMQNYSELQQQVARTHTINDQIQQRVINLQQQLQETRVKVSQSQKNQQKYMQEQNKLFLRIQQLVNENKIIKQRINYVQNQLRAKTQEYLTYQQKQSDYQIRYVKVLDQLTKRNQDLVFQILAVNQRNHVLLNQRDYYMNKLQNGNNSTAERLPYHQFVSILQATDGEVQTLKRKMDLKSQEIEQINTQNEQERLNLQSKINQLNNLLQIRQSQFRNRQQILENEAQIHRKQYQLMLKRNQQIKTSQVKLRLQIIEKDRIIMDFVEKQKMAEQLRNRQNNSVNVAH